jgi:hypothetical protein
MGKNSDQKNQVSADQKDRMRLSFREWIAFAMIVLSVGLLITLSVIGFGIIKNTDSVSDKFKDIQALFGMLLPLIGTWVGTVLAYYFSKENFVAASQSVNDLVRHITSVEEKFHDIKVTEVMQKPENFPYGNADTTEALEKFKIQDLVDEMNAKNVERYPILIKNSLKFVFLFYRSTLERFQIGFINGTIKLVDPKKSHKINDLTVKDMFDSDFQLIKDVREITKKKKFLPVDATLEDVRALMMDNVICQDVFITQTGNKDEKVEGWITNDLVIEKAELFKRTRGV